MEIFADQADDLLEFPAMLSKIKALAAWHFPNAVKFIRPGFDSPGEPAEQH